MRATIDRRDLIAALKATAPCRSANAHLPAIPSSPCVTTIDLGESGAA